MTLNAAPLLSVIIPTHKRPQFLSRAIDSALLSAPDGDVEVLVIPNGADLSWQNVAEKYQSETRVKWHAIATAHANAARNKGLELAQGEYIRFLDDDDYFYPENACEQLKMLISSDADLSYSCLDHVNMNGKLIKQTEPDNKNDYVTAVVGTGNPTAPSTLVYKKQLIADHRWSESVNKKQDVYWVYSICKQNEFKAIYFAKPAGVWVQHDGDRVSKGHNHKLVTREEAEQLLELAECLRNQKRLNKQRATAISVALWQRLHDGMMYDIVYWYKVSKLANAIMPNQHPRSVMYKNSLIRLVSPFFIELAIVPFRWLRVAFGHQYPL